MNLRTLISESEWMKRLIVIYGLPVTDQAYLLDAVAGPIETMSHSGVDGISNLAQESGVCIQGDDGGVVLDAGCGVGLVTLLARQRGLNVIGVDLDQCALDLAWQLGCVAGITEGELSSTLVLGDVADLSYPDDYFSMIVSYQVIEHVDDAAKMLCELVRCLRPQGILCVVGPDYRFSFEPHYRIPWLPFMEKKVDAVSWLEGFGRPVEGLSTFSYTSLPQCLKLLIALDVEVMRTYTTMPETRIEEQRQLLLRNGDKDDVGALAVRVRQGGIQTAEVSFTVTARKV